MNTPVAIKLADDVAGIAEHLKEELANDYPRRDVFQEIFLLRRSVEQLEREVRDLDIDTLGDAC